MSIQRHQKGSVFEEKIGYARLVTAGPFVFVSGTTGYNYDTMEISEDVVAQARQCIENIRAALQSVDADLSDTVRVNYYLRHAEDFESCWPVLSDAFGAHPPAATMIEANMATPEMLIEIELTAMRGR